jgi:hypothetical protein
MARDGVIDIALFDIRTFMIYIELARRSIIFASNGLNPWSSAIVHVD